MIEAVRGDARIPKTIGDGAVRKRRVMLAPGKAFLLRGGNDPAVLEMNGAIAEPLVRTTSPPNTTIMIRIGNSQNFFRTRINRQSSATKSICFL